MFQSAHRAGAAARLRGVARFASSTIAAGVALVIAGAAAAGEAAAPADQELAEVTVTGTRIRQVTGMDTPTPVTAISVDELQTMSASSVTEALTQLPQFFDSNTAENFGAATPNRPGQGGFFQSPGGGSLNLRGIGSDRTLTLLDGRRMPAASIVAGPDVSTFPDQLMQRVESVTGGASAAYGTDAVSGVVNYILDTKFDGIKASAQFGYTDRGDGANEKYSFSLGHALGGKTHVLFSVGHSHQTAINHTGDRDWYQGCGLITNPALATNAPNSATSKAMPRLIPACNLRTTQSSIDGVLNPAGTGALGRITFDANGLAIPFARGSLVDAGGNTQVGGSGEDTADVLNVLLPSAKRSNAFTYLNYDITDNLSLYAQGLYSEQLLSRLGLVGGYGVGGLHSFTIFQDNAFLPDPVRQVMVANNIASTTFNRQMSPLDGAVGLFNNESREKVGTLGFHGRRAGGFLDGWSADGYFQYGTTQLDWAQIGGTRQDRVFLAIDAVRDAATGTIRCRINVVSPNLVPGCQPLNLFGRGNASAAAIDWVTGFDPGVAVSTRPYVANAQGYAAEPYTYIGDEAKHRLVRLNQRVAEFAASGKVLEGWAGPIAMAIGANYRRESVNQRVRASQGNLAADPTWYPVWCNDPGAANGTQQCATTNVPGTTQSILARQISQGRPAGAIGVRGVPNGVGTNLVETQFSNVPNIQGSYDVKELFNETVVPLLKDQPWMKSLSFQGAARWADYAGSGQIWSWKGGLDAELTGELRLRGTYSHDTRAGNIADRFDRTGGLGSAIDKKVPGAGEPPVLTTTQSFTVVSGGNPGIDPEVGNTFTVGLVYRPDWLPRFDLSIDWLRVKLDDAIEAYSAQTIVDKCYQDGDQDQCARITRSLDGSGNDVIVFINQSKQNINKATFDAVDFEMGYSLPVHLFGGGERLTARLFGSYLIEASTTNFAGVKTDSTGSLPSQYFTKKLNLNLGYTRNQFSWNLNGRYNNGGTTVLTWNQPDAAGITNWNEADNHTGGSVYWDTRLAYRIPLGGGQLEVFGNVQNLLDRDPPRVLTQGVGAQISGGYDQIGRRYVMGVNLRF
jgi:iron complex outermembrane recepter protein